MNDEQEKNDEQPEPAKSLAEKLAELSKDQLATVKAQVDQATADRDVGLARMPDGEAREHVRKRYGYSPKF